MKKASIIVAALLLTTAAFAQTKTVTKAPVAAANGMEFFHGTWAQALAKAKKENKLVFLDAYTSWCGPCKQMQRNVFPQTTVGSFFNKNFVNVKVDMEEGEGPALAQRYPIEGYPKMFILNANGDIVQSQLGAIPAEKLIAFGRSALK